MLGKSQQRILHILWNLRGCIGVSCAQDVNNITYRPLSITQLPNQCASAVTVKNCSAGGMKKDNLIIQGFYLISWKGTGALCIEHVECISK